MRPLGQTGNLVSEIGLGCARLGGVLQGASKAETLSLLAEAFDAGITFYDTADLYSQGESERLLGEAFRRKREQVFIATKVGYTRPGRRHIVDGVKPLMRPMLRRLGFTPTSKLMPGLGGALAQDFSPEYILRATRESLKRLGGDYIDLLQLHSPPASVLERAEFLEPLLQLREQGMVRHIGIACERLDDVFLCLPHPEIEVVQVSVNLLHQQGLREVLATCSRAGVGVIGRQCFASGLLAKPLRELDLTKLESDPTRRAFVRDQLQRFDKRATEIGFSLRELALQFARSWSAVSVTLVGVRTVEHLRESLRTLERAPLSAAQQATVADPVHNAPATL
jgi:aryl-alcohol dehydrogenase-like predicted oxidoreductase